MAGLLVVLGGIWIAVTGLLVRGQLQSARNDLIQLRAQVNTGDFAAARVTAANLRSHARQADHLSSGPAWAVAAGIPGNDPFDTVRTLTQQMDVLAGQVLPQLSAVSDGLDPKRLLSAGGAVNLAPITRAEPVLHSAVTRLERARATMATQPSHTWFGPIDNARNTLVDQFGSLIGQLRAADTAARILPTVLGSDGPKRYFVGFQNDAEMRGTGGLPGAFGILQADRGKVRFQRFENDGYLGGVRVNLSFGAAYDSTFASNDTEGDYRNTNLSPHFPYAARLWMAMWQKKTGQRLDGALTLDPTALSYLLRATGPVKAGTTEVNSGDVVFLTQSLVYAVYGNDVNARKAFLLGVARAVGDHVLAVGASTSLVRSAADAVGERRLLFYSADASVEKAITGTSLAGEVPQGGGRYSGVSIVNLGGNKLDYYLKRSIAYSATGCGRYRTSTVTITLTNAAPAGLPSYVTNRVDQPLPAGYRPGDNRLLLSYYAGPGTTLRSARFAEGAALFYPQSLLGHPVWAFDIELPRGATRTLTVRLDEPSGSSHLDILRQPGIQPLSITSDQTKC